MSRKPITVEQAVREGWFQPNELGGLCHCGCGEVTGKAIQSDRRIGLVRGEHVKYKPGHATRGREDTNFANPAISIDQATAEGWFRPNTQGGKCHCGCGQFTPLAKSTSRRSGRVKGYPQRFISGHTNGHFDVTGEYSWYKPNTNNGLCHCGCGEKAPLATGTNKVMGYIKGQPVRYVAYHKQRSNRKSDTCVIMEAGQVCGLPTSGGYRCSHHEYRWRRGSRVTPNSLPGPAVQPCSTPGCVRNYRVSTGRNVCSVCARSINPVYQTLSLKERIDLHLFKPDGETGCWLWHGATASSRTTNPIVNYDGRTWSVRKTLYEQLHDAQLKPGVLVFGCTKHDNCVNPRHCRARGSTQDTCAHGHEWTDANTYRYSKNGKEYRQCRECRQVYDRARRPRRIGLT